jgi:type IV fimbrial biogenesis protein FimT
MGIGARSRESGFSLIELVVTLTILALLAFAVFPSMADWMRNTRVRNSAESIQNGLQKARNEALRRNQNVTFWLVSQSDDRVIDNGCALSTESGSWVVSLSSPAGLCGTAPSTDTAPMIVETHAAGQGGGGVAVAAVASDGTSSSSVTFNGFGQVVQSGKPISTVDFTGARRLRVLVSTGGAVRMCDRDVASTDPRACAS